MLLEPASVLMLARDVFKAHISTTRAKGNYMDGCAIDLLCELGSFHFKLVLYFVFTGTVYWFGIQHGKKEAFREGFINGVQYYLNIVAYNAAKIPEKIDEDANACIKEAKERLAKHIKPLPPNCS